MLEEFVHLEKGDVVVQNGGNSAVGQVIIKCLVSEQQSDLVRLQN